MSVHQPGKEAAFMPDSKNLLVERISDTALWAAAYRALEGQKPDPLFKDPFAGELAGDKGRRIAHNLKGGQTNAFSFGIRTRFFDDTILEAVKNRGVDGVFNLGSGLDTRAYRLDLPASLHWFDVDLPDIVSYMNEKMRAHQPRCLLERYSWDINDGASRQELLSKVGQKAKKVLVVSEGVITYFTSQQVDSLVKDLNALPCFKFWLHDFYSHKVIERLQKEWKSQFSQDAIFHFDPENWFKFFEARGWKIARWTTVIDEVRHLNRKLPPAWVVWKWLSRIGVIREKVPSGYVLLEKA